MLREVLGARASRRIPGPLLGAPHALDLDEEQAVSGFQRCRCWGGVDGGVMSHRKDVSRS